MQQTQDPKLQDPAQRFLISAIASVLRLVMTPLYYAIRTDMGVQFSAFYPIAMSLALYGVAARLLALWSEVDGACGALFFMLVVLGYIRNCIQARRRRQTRDWSVNSWSTGSSLMEPVVFFVCRLLSRKWGREVPAIRRLVRLLLSIDFLHYVAEPAMLVAVAVALWSIGFTLWGYVVAIAIALILVRYDAQLRLYLQAHELADAQMMERVIRSEFETPSSIAGGGVTVTQVPAAPSDRKPANEQTVFDRLSPDLQSLLLRDNALQH